VFLWVYGVGGGVWGCLGWLWKYIGFCRRRQASWRFVEWWMECWANVEPRCVHGSEVREVCLQIASYFYVWLREEREGAMEVWRIKIMSVWKGDGIMELSAVVRAVEYLLERVRLFLGLSYWHELLLSLDARLQCCDDCVACDLLQMRKPTIFYKSYIRYHYASLRCWHCR
jgi:hypothetical protein